MKFNATRPSAALAVAAMAFMSACSADRTTGPVANTAPTISAKVVSAATVIVPGSPAGSFTTFIANNSGRGSTEFWDNLSADNTASVLSCNIGFYASGTMQSGCQNESAGSTANQGGYTRYYGDGPGSRDATAFSFASGFEYTVTLEGSYAGDVSEVGYYTLVGGTYTWIPVPAWSTKNIGTSVTINTTGTWGFYIKNETLSPTGGCGGTAYYCTAADGGFTGTPFQQFALFTNAAENSFLVGAEDNRLELLPNRFFRDSDYNDYIWSISAASLTSVCDFMTFGRTQIEAGGTSVVISGNAGGNSPQGGVLGNFLVKVGDTQYNLQDIAFYGPITSGVFSDAALYPNARRIVGTTREGDAVEIRIYDGSEPGRIADAVYVRIGATTPLGVNGVSLDRGNIQYHPQCRGPK
ncbi:MAG TPA: hypothetical protein VE861_13040 [Gemmatimonadaceae bacterium]|nr:hypothetical protein [Gemmatimonadaceae bacterium]